MKIQGSIRLSYNGQLEVYKLLRERFDKMVESKKDSRWHYESRIKSQESYAQKLETGRFDTHSMEDLFAATIVVVSIDEIDKAEGFIASICDTVERRPKDAARTHKSPAEFPFDDLRLYVKLKPDPALPTGPIYDLVFEVQIKTYLQHAWVIATHDLAYKANNISWARQRIAFQAKAMLESVESTISSSEVIAAHSVAINKENSETEKLKAIVKLLQDNWNVSELPDDIIRLSRVIMDFCDSTKVSLESIREALKQETKSKRGVNLTNLSPYQVIVQSLLNTEEPELRKFLTSRKKNRFRVLLTSEIQIPAGYPSIADDKIIRC